MSKEIPEWAKKRVIELTDADPRGSYLKAVMADFEGNAPRSWLAFARYIAEHEEPPVDPDLIEAREMAAATMLFIPNQENVRRGLYDGYDTVKLRLEGIKRGRELQKRENG